MNYRQKMRKAIECPQFGNIDYGEWGSLNLIQRKDIKRLVDEMDRADEYIKTLYFKNENLQDKINRAIAYMEKYNEFVVPDANIESLILKEEYKKIINILKEDK